VQYRRGRQEGSSIDQWCDIAGAFVPDAFGPGSFVEPPLPGAVPVGAPGLPAVSVEAPGLTIGGVLGVPLSEGARGARRQSELTP
jgi:hypothetical protein